MNAKWIGRALIFASGMVVGATLYQAYLNYEAKKSREENFEKSKETPEVKKEEVKPQEPMTEMPYGEELPELTEEEKQVYAQTLKEWGYAIDPQEPPKYFGPADARPHPISEEEYVQNEDDYDIIPMLLYADGVVAGDDDREVEDYERVLGFDVAKKFHQYEYDDVVYVKDDRLRVIYEISRSAKTYEEQLRQHPELLQEDGDEELYEESE